MSLFLSLVTRLLPLYLTMAAGAAMAGKGGGIVGGLAMIQIFLVAPVIILVNTMKLQVDPQTVALPFLFAAFCAAISGATHLVARARAPSRAPLLAQAAGGTNAGYLGVPVAMILFPPEWIAPYLFAMTGGVLYESTLGYYWIARGRFSVREALAGLAKLPVLYALLAGLALNYFRIDLPPMWEGVARDFMGAYVVLGALIIGFAIGQNRKAKICYATLSVMLGIKFIVWPAAAYGLIMALRALSFGLPTYGEHIFLLFGMLPLAANTAAYAALMKFRAEEAALAVAVSTFLSLFIVPAYAMLFGLV